MHLRNSERLVESPKNRYDLYLFLQGCTILKLLDNVLLGIDGLSVGWNNGVSLQ